MYIETSVELSERQFIWQCLHTGMLRSCTTFR